MIRIDYPTGALTQIRQRLQLAARRTRRALEERRRVLRTEVTERAEARDAYLHLRWRQDIDRERRGYTSLYEQYDALVGLLCLAAHEGVEPELEEAYRERRAWFCAHYPGWKRTISAYLENDPSDGVSGRFGRRACDAFEALFFPGTIDAALAADGGNLIGRLMRTQAALLAWKESLDQREQTCDNNA